MSTINTPIAVTIAGEVPGDPAATASHVGSEQVDVATGISDVFAALWPEAAPIVCIRSKRIGTVGTVRTTGKKGGTCKGKSCNTRHVHLIRVFGPRHLV